ncbi:MAG: SUMF1/EgtB/PvdO family nonheme iron enzyme [Kiritimatiellia bacterium]|nr:SUMF1/EgtB/PvdO family nonheme iron enzyme [Kiritimatiellia bacterium]
MRRDTADFSRALEALLDGSADETDRRFLDACLREDPECIEQYCGQMETHLLLRLSRTCETGRTEPAAPRFPRRVRPGGIAAAAALAVLAGVLFTLSRRVPFTPAPVPALPPVTALHHYGSAGLELPRTLPGTVRLLGGMARVSLPSGVELILEGPLELALETADGGEARLATGRLIAWVPPRAKGLILRTAEIEAWDIGTVFAVSADAAAGSRVFVYKGAVQVNDREGCGAALCEAGEGVLAPPGRAVVKIASDWPEAQRLFRRAAGHAALKTPADALDVARRIGDQWQIRYEPEEVPPPPPPVPGLRGVGRVSPKPPRTPRGGVPTVARRASGVAKLSQTPAAVTPPATKEKTMRTMTKTVAAVAAVATLGAGAARAETGFSASVSGVTLAQRDNTRTVDIGYTLTGGDAIITLAIETNGVAIPDSAVTTLSGDVCRLVQEGTRSIVWNAGADWPEHEVTNARARVTAWSTNAPPQVMVIDLNGGSTAEDYPVYYYTSLEALPYGGLTNAVYKQTRLAMRKIPAGTFMMGEGTGAKEVTLTKDFYAGVFEVTQGQWFNVMGSGRTANFTDASSRAFRPMEMVSYYDIRENPDNSAITPNWPESDDVHANSFMGKLRAKAGDPGFDLPTEAQWEYACRAGTTTYYNDGLGTPMDTTSNAQMDVLGRYQYNGGRLWDDAKSQWVDPAPSCDPTNGTAIAGSYLPNAWGLYDMHGNVCEWCLDWQTTLTGGIDPKGPDSGLYREFRGGGWNSNAAYCRSAFRNCHAPSDRAYGYGFRLVRTLP